jgi:hypothetical protein
MDLPAAAEQRCLALTSPLVFDAAETAPGEAYRQTGFYSTRNQLRIHIKWGIRFGFGANGAMV